MYARTTLLEIDTMRVSVDDALAQFEASVVPRLSSQAGFDGLYALTTPEGKAMVISFWETPEQADASGDNAWYSEVLTEFMTMFRAAPGRDRYEVRLTVSPPVRATA